MAALTGYFGGKNAMSSWIYSYIPKDIKTYCEVFSGSFAIYFNEDFSGVENIIYNDFNKWQANFIACCVDHEKMKQKLNDSFKEGGFLYCPLSDTTSIKKFYRDLYTMVKNPSRSDYYDNSNFNVPDFDHAVIYAFMITSAFNACHARGAGFSGFTKTNKLKLSTLINKLGKKEYHDKLEKITEVESMDFANLISKYDSPDTYFYLDPPYKHTSGVGTHDQDYGSKSIFGEASHERLAKILQNTQAKWSLSYYYFKELEEWFPRDKYNWVSKEFHRSSASFSENSAKGVEILIMNY